MSHKATDVGEIAQEKEHAGGDAHRAKLSTTPTCKGWREEKGPGEERKKTRITVAKKPRERGSQEKDWRRPTRLGDKSR